MASASREKADAFLDEQIALAKKQSTIADLQIEDLKREDKLRHWSLIVHHFSDVLKLAFEFAVAAIVLGTLHCSRARCGRRHMRTVSSSKPSPFHQTWRHVG